MPARILYLFLFLRTYVGLRAQSTIEGGDPIEIISAKELSYDKARLGEVKRLIGNVGFKQKDMVMFCDSAYWDESKNKFTAFRNVRIQQGDSLFINGDLLNYEGDTKVAVLTGKTVTLSDRQFFLTTTSLNYDAKNRTGYYTNGATIISADNTLKSVTGSYHAPSKTFGFRKQVVLENPKYTMKCDTLQYNQASGVAYFFGPTYIYAENNTTIYCENGWFDTRTNSSQFSKNSYLQTPTQFLTADSMTYNGRESIDRAFGHILLVDSTNKVEIRGDRGIHYRRLNLAKVIGEPIAAMRSREGDTMYIASDTLTTLFDTARQNRLMYAYYHVRMFQKDFTGKCDSLFYSVKDSLIHMERDPLIWNKENQVSSDTIYLYLSNNMAEHMELKKNVFIISRDSNNKYNQIKGRNAEAYFINNEIRKVDVNGDGQSVYYVKEDSATYTGVNKIICSSMRIFIANNEISEVRFYTQPEGIMYPLEKAPPSEIRLKGFTWRTGEKPVLGYDALKKRRKLNNP